MARRKRKRSRSLNGTVSFTTRRGSRVSFTTRDGKRRSGRRRVTRWQRIFGRAARLCTKAGNKPGTKAFAACLKSKLKRARKK